MLFKKKKVCHLCVFFQPSVDYVKLFRSDVVGGQWRTAAEDERIA